MSKYTRETNHPTFTNNGTAISSTKYDDTIIDLHDESIPQIADVSTLRSFNGSGYPDGKKIWLQGYNSNRDGGEGIVYKDDSDTTTSDNGGTVFVDADGVRWKRPYAFTTYVKWFGDGKSDDSTAIQGAIDACPEGGRVYFSEQHTIENQIILKSGITYYGHNHNQTRIIQKDNSNITDALFVQDVWDNNSTAFGQPIIMRDVFIDGNKDNNGSTETDGVLLQVFNCLLENVNIFECTGNGIHLTDQNKSGTNVSGTAVENRIINSRITRCDKNGVKSDGNTSAITDGLLTDSIIGINGEHGVSIQQSGGWHITDNHIYNSGFHSIFSTGGGTTTICNNDIEEYGGSSTNGTYYAIWSEVIVDDKPNIINDNRIKNVNTVTGNSYGIFRITYGSGVSTGKQSIKGNDCIGNGSETGVSIGGSGDGRIDIFNNSIEGIDESSRNTIVGSVSVIRHANNSFDHNTQTIASNSSPSVQHGTLFETNSGSFTISDFDNGFEGQKITLLIKHSGINIDFTSSGLKGNGGSDWSPNIGDHMNCIYDGSDWYCDISNNTA